MLPGRVVLTPSFLGTARLRPPSVSGRESLPGASPIRSILITASLSLSYTYCLTRIYGLVLYT